MIPADRAILAVLLLLLVTVPLYLVASRGRPLDPEVARRGRTVLLGYRARDWLMWTIGPLERAMVRARVSPDLLNVLGALFGVAAGVAFAAGATGTAGWMILLGGAADIFDGRVARARGIVAPHGAFLDSTLDRFAETFAFAGLALLFAGRPAALLGVVLALGASLLVSYARARGEALGVQGVGGVMQRAERLVLLALAALLDGPVALRAGWAPGSLLAGAAWIIALGALGTAVYRTVHVARVLRGRGTAG